ETTREGRLALNAVNLGKPGFIEDHGALRGCHAFIRFEFDANGIQLAGTDLVALSDVPAALLRKLHGVDEVDAMGRRAAEHTGHTRVAQQAGIAIGELAEVNEANGFRISGGDIRSE